MNNSANNKKPSPFTRNIGHRKAIHRKPFRPATLPNSPPTLTEMAANNMSNKPSIMESLNENAARELGARLLKLQEQQKKINHIENNSGKVVKLRNSNTPRNMNNNTKRKNNNGMTNVPLNI